jgi:ribosomal protein S3
LQKEFDAQSKENKGLCIAIGSKDADIAALKEKLSSMLQDKDLQIKAVRKVVRD